MSANDQAIIERIAQNPKCRAVQLSDWLDVPVDDVQGQLAALIAVGDVSGTQGTAPSGTPCQVYELTTAFRESDRGLIVLAKAEITAFREAHPTLGNTALAVAFVQKRGSATSTELGVLLNLGADEYPSTVLASAVTNGKLVRDGKSWTLGLKAFPDMREQVAPTPAPTTVPSPARPESTVDRQAKSAATPPSAPRSGPSKVQLAIDCITRLGAATDDQLRDAMKLDPKAYVGAYLAAAIKGGRVVRDGDRWTIPKALDSVERVGNIIIASRDNSPIPQTVVDAITKAPAEGAPAAARHRCAVWSDGTFELETNGERVAVLTHEQAVTFVSFIERIGAA